MKKSLLINLHVYCGLFTCFYLLSLGTSSLVLNHKIEVDKKDVTQEWESKVAIDTTLADLDLAESIRDQLGMMGWVPPWRYHKEKDAFSFEITHLGKNSDIRTEFASGRVQVTEYRKGFLAVLHGMHFFNGKIPNAPFILRSFAVYQYLGLLVLLISLILGLWLWIKFSYHPWELYLFGFIFLSSLLIMILI
ncbi:MAG: hypothetical protein HKN76_04930 [Saprospiraceae bacterium]|nr:hypothetical protein [Saprospiraceae bacterium]